MADTQLHSSTSTLSVDQDLPEMEKPRPSAGDIYGEDDSGGIESGDKEDAAKENQDLEKGPSKHHPPAQLDWDGPDDPENPHNWPLGKKIMHIVIPAVISLTA
jgi:hypothetical protein